MSATSYVPPVPPDPPDPLPDLVPEDVRVWRVHWERDPRKPPPRDPYWRFDATGGEYRVTYGNVDKYASFGETYRDARLIPPEDRARRLSCLSSTRPLAILQLDDPQVLAAFGLGLEISQSRDYERTRAWGAAWRSWYGEAIDGVRYVGRKSIARLNYCLFLDRAGGDLDVHFEGRLEDLRPVVMRACAGYRLAPLIFA